MKTGLCLYLATVKPSIDIASLTSDTTFQDMRHK